MLKGLSISGTLVITSVDNVSTSVFPAATVYELLLRQLAEAAELERRVAFGEKGPDRRRSAEKVGRAVGVFVIPTLESRE